jgi:putative DNA primase/helicase
MSRMYDMDSGRRPTQKESPADNAIPPPPDDGIEIVGGKLPEIVDATESALLDAGVPIYARGAMLVRPLVLPQPRQIGRDMEIPAGTLVLEGLDSRWLVYTATRAAKFYKFDRRSWEWLRVDCPPRVAETYLALPGHWRAPIITGTIEAPTIRMDGSILATPGYDPATGLYLHAPDIGSVDVADRPTKDDVAQAIAVLLDLLADFPFAEPADKSVAIAAILTALVRRQLPTSPMFAVNAPAAGSGKTLMADVPALAATGRPALVMVQATTVEEQQKHLGALMIEGASNINIDNVESVLEGEFFCAVLSSPAATVRVLGQSKSPSLPTNFLLVATGNNLTIRGDLRRRALEIRLDPAVENPDRREFDRDLRAWIPDHRAEIVSAALTILRGYHVAGRPSLGLTPFGSFEAWSDWVRAPIVWAGLPDPCDTRARLDSGDPITTALAGILPVWHREMGHQKLTVRDLISQCEMGPHSDLKTALLDVASRRRDPNQLDPLRLAHWLRRSERRIVGGLRLEQAGELKEKVVWTVNKVR